MIITISEFDGINAPERERDRGTKAGNLAQKAPRRFRNLELPLSHTATDDFLVPQGLDISGISHEINGF
jgi:hypothetical protein